MTAPATGVVPPADAAPPLPRSVGYWLRAVGALVFWGTVQGVALLPAHMDQSRPFQPAIPPAAGVAVNALVALGFVWWFVLRPGARASDRRRSTLRLRRAPGGVWPWVALAGAAAAVAVTVSLVILPRFFRLPSGDRVQEWVVAGYTRTPLGVVSFLVLVALVAPLLEEFLFRGWLQGQLERRLRPWPAILLTAVAFTAAHGNEAIGVLPRFGLAVAAGYAAWATRSIWPSVTLHGMYNAGVVVGQPVLPRVLPAVPPMEAWADAERAALYYWARDPRAFAAAALVLAIAIGLAAWALTRVAALAGRDRGAVAEPGAGR